MLIHGWIRQVFHQTDIKMDGQKGPFIVERPKVLYNAKTKLFVLWFHLDTGGYKFRHAGIATSATANGPFKFVHGIQPDGIPSLDMSLFRDPQDGQAYFVRSCNNAYTGISRLTDDYLDSKGMISNHSVFEGMALFRHPNGTYYIITSHLTGEPTHTSNSTLACRLSLVRVPVSAHVCCIAASSAHSARLPRLVVGFLWLLGAFAAAS